MRGAREHNLKNIDVDVPRDALVVFSGVSGSGKSSLAFGTLYAEAQRRYFESVAPYARRLIDQVGVPDVDSIEGLPPAVALQQQRGTPSARSSVGSVTTLSTFVRMLYSRPGIIRRAADLSGRTSLPTRAGRVFPTVTGGVASTRWREFMVPFASLRERAIASFHRRGMGITLRDILDLVYEWSRGASCRKRPHWIFHRLAADGAFLRRFTP